MSRNINFQYDYPFSLWTPASRYNADWSVNQISLNGFNLHTLDFQRSPVPHIINASIRLFLTPTSGTNASNRNWRLYFHNGSSWQFHTFFMPHVAMNNDIEFVWTGTLNSNVSRVTACPASSASSMWWQLGIDFEVMRVRENLNTVTLSSNEYFSGLLTNQWGVTQRPSQIHANVDGVIRRATRVLLNVDGVLRELPSANNGSFVSTVPDTHRVFEFTPPITGTYRIEVVTNSGDHEARLFNASFARIHPNGTSGNTNTSFFRQGEFSLTAGNLHYLSLIHWVHHTGTSDSTVFISRN